MTQLASRADFIAGVIAQVKVKFPTASDADIEFITNDTVIRCEDYMNREIVDRLSYAVTTVVINQLQRLIDKTTNSTQVVASMSDNGQSVTYQDKTYLLSLDNDLFNSIIPQLNVYRKLRT